MTPEERKAARKAKQDAELAAHVDKVVANCLPLSKDQFDRLALLLNPQFHGTLPRMVSPYEQTLQTIAGLKEELRSARKRMEDDMAGCHGRGLTEQVHRIQKGHAMGYHDWVALSPDDMIKTIKSHKPKIARIEKKIAELESRTA